MRLRFFNPQESREVLYETEYEIQTWLRRGKWVTDWEWVYDFPDLRRDLIADFKFCVAHFCLKVLSWLGVVVAEGRRHEAVAVSYEEIETDEIFGAIETQMEQYYSRFMEPSMIIIGPDARRELMNIYEPFTFPLEVRLGERKLAEGPFGKPVTVDNMYVNNVPCLFVPSATGITVLPDMTGHWSKNLLGQRAVGRYERRYSR
jgi:hypothetical protein